jgi:APA family basic amino acid/polyamine antiporter
MQNNTTGLKRRIGFWAAVSIIVGSIIGSGVFMKPATMAAQVHSPVWLALVWIIAGAFSLFGALIYAEAGAMFPETGGQYVFFKKMYTPVVGFLYGWGALAVINTAAVAAISFVCAQYAGFFLQLPRFDAETEKQIIWHIPFIGDLYPLQNFGVKSLAIILVLLFTSLNVVSVKWSSRLQFLSTLIKVGVLAILVLGIFLSGKGDFKNFTSSSVNPLNTSELIAGIVAALTGAFMAYDGWINATFLAGEIKNPQRTIPRSLIIGVVICMIAYLLVNQAYLYVLPVDEMAKSSLVASDAIAIALGKTSEAIVAAMIVICTFGAINGNIMATTRITYAMSRDKFFFSWAGKENKSYGTPGNALWLHAIWTIVFIISGSFDMLADMFTFISWIAYLGGAIGIILLRKKMPDAQRPYRMWGYPVVPVLFIGFTLFYLITTIRNDISNYSAGKAPVINSLLGILITALGLPLYFYFRSRNKKDL